MARTQLGTAPSNAADTATKGYVDQEIATISLTPGASGASGVPGASGEPGASGGTGGVGATGPAGASGEPGASGQPGATGPTGASGASGGTGGTGGTGAPGPTTARNISTITENTTLGASGGTDYVVFLDASTTDSFKSTIAHLHLEGSNNSTTITDTSNARRNWTANGNAKLSTTTSKFGSTSLTADGPGDWIQPSSGETDFAFPADFTIEMFIYPTGSGERIFYDGRPSGGNGAYPTLYLPPGGGISYYTKTADRITGGTVSNNTWYHVAVSRSGTSTRLFLNGTQIGSTYTDSTSYLSETGRPAIGTSFTGYIDEVRITKGVARYTSNFTAPSSAFTDGTVGTPTLPTAVGNTNHYTLLNISGGGPITVNTTSSQQIDGIAAGSYTLATAIQLISDGTNWRTI